MNGFANTLAFVPPTEQKISVLESSDNTSAAYVYGVYDALRQGKATASVAHDLLPCHPIQSSLQQWSEHSQQMKYTHYKYAYGMHLPLRLQTQRTLVSHIRRGPGLPSHRLALDVLEGRECDMDAEHIFAESQFACQNSVNVHTAMEQLLRM